MPLLQPFFTPSAVYNTLMYVRIESAVLTNDGQRRAGSVLLLPEQLSWLSSLSFLALEHATKITRFCFVGSSPPGCCSYQTWVQEAGVDPHDPFGVASQYLQCLSVYGFVGSSIYLGEQGFCNLGLVQKKYKH